MNTPSLERFEAKVAFCPKSGCWLWTGHRYSQGYGAFHVAGKVVRSHRIAWQFYCGRIPPGLWVLHKCDVRHCVNPYHLFLGTRADNTADMVSKGRQPRALGERNSHAKLTASDVLLIRADDRASHLIAADYSVSQSAIRWIKRRGTWTHVGDSP